MSATNNPVPATAVSLGVAGLMPFVILALVPPLFPAYAELAQRALALYSLGILCFLCGTWWGIGVMRRAPAPLLLGNALTLAAIFSFLLLDTRQFFVVACALFPLQVWLEGKQPAFSAQPGYYRRLRLWLSGVAAIALGLASLTAA